MMAKVKGLSEEQPLDSSKGFQSIRHARLKIDGTGRIVVPAEMRAAMGVAEGDTVLARVVDGEFRLLSQQAALRRAQTLVRQFVPEGTRLVDQLLEDRRAETTKELGS